MARIRREEMSHAAKGGIIAGLAAGVVSTLIGLIATLSNGGDAWMALKGAGAPFLGARAMAPGFDAGAVLVGLLCHYLVSAGWGLLFGLLFYGFSRAATLGLGALWGIVVWLGMYYVVLPLVGLGEMARSVPVGMAIVSHVIFGLALAAAFLPFQRHVERPLGPRLTTPAETAP
jgi:hypothetical protein